MRSPAGRTIPLTDEPEGRPFLRRTLVPLIVFLTAFAVYVNTLWGGFVFDDLWQIVHNRWIRDPGFLTEIFRSHAAGFDPESATSYYRPMMHVGYMIVYHLAGLNPAAFHLVNVLLHAAVSVLACLIARDLMNTGSSASGSGEIAPLAVGLLFATHPVHAEAVAWLGGIPDLSFTAFTLWAFLVYIRAKQAGTVRYLLAGVLFFAATLCKEPALVLPPLIVVYEATFRRDKGIQSGLVARALPFAVAAGLYLVMRIHALGGFAASRGPHDHQALVFILSALDLFSHYLYTLVLPVDLNALHIFRPVESLLDARALAAFAVSAGLAIAAWRLRRCRTAIIGLAFVVLPLLPALYIPALSEGAFAERYLYLPVLGFAILLTLAVRETTERRPASRSVAAAFLIFLVLAYAAGSMTRNRVWRDSLSLWSDTARKSPDSAAAQEYLCFAQYTAGQPRDALQSCRRALELDEQRIDARINLATTLSVLGDLDGAVREFQEVLRRRPGSAQANTNLGLVYMAKGRADLAMDSYRNALRANPFYAEAHNDLGVALALTGRREEAIAELTAAVRLAPDNREYVSNLAAAQTGPNTPAAGR